MPTLARAVAVGAGWMYNTPDLHEPAVIGFMRYIGVDNPDAELQSAHFAQLEDALTAAGLHFESISHGIVVAGHTNPPSAAGLVIRADTEHGRDEILRAAPRIEEATFLGSCFAFRHSNTFVTAGHCVRDIEPRMLFVNTEWHPPWRPIEQVLQVHHHPTADVAVLKLDEAAWPGPVDPFADVGDLPRLGSDFMAYGYPEDAPDPTAAEPAPTARLFRGYFQRVFRYHHDGYDYQAGEMSLPSPAGLSGGALFPPETPSTVVGVAAANVQSTTYVGRYEETTEAGVSQRSIERDHVQYGIAVLLPVFADWLDALAPHVARMPSPAPGDTPAANDLPVALDAQPGH